MDIDPKRAPTPGRLAPAAISPHHLASDRGWNILRSSTHVGIGGLTHVTDVLCIAARHLDHLRPHLHLLAPRLDDTPGALGADRHGDLVSRPAIVLRSLQDLPGHQQENIVVRQAAAAVPA